ncbi:membrane protein required for colicin V production [Pseudoxanthomonas sp. 3HH-4]|uniref:CvpA family protein n=1 Tax=Pseudoxanthomonas sp. 3HH-4 TaxID=1690214 RepID=UPI0011508B48|nr:CvpA family protein [Pseudoxanthomonas sp. 3HH-4]TQM13080.1 membrane protein required for colicin V production [Pseudoxanthomonas sp. 3HH-4]
MSALDLTLLAIVGVSTLFGVMRGFISALASMVAWLLAGWVAFHYGGDAAYWLSSDGQPSASELLGGYALSFIGVMIFVGLTGWAIRHLVKSVGLSGLDRVLGLALGFARGAFVACIVLLLVAFTNLPREPEWRRSSIVPMLLPGAQWLSQWLPEWTVQELDFGNGRPAGDNARLQNLLPMSLEDTGAPQDHAPSSASPASKPE